MDQVPDGTVEVLCQLPEPIGTPQTVPPGRTGHPTEMHRHRYLWQLDQGVEGHRTTTEQVEQQLPRAVGEGNHPLTDCGAGWAFPDQAFDQAIDTQSTQEAERDDLLLERDRIVSESVQEIGEQAVGAPADLAADALHTDVIDRQARAGLSLVGPSADQGVGRWAVRMRTAVGNRKLTAWKRCGLGVVLRKIRVVLHNDHVGAPPFVVLSAKMCPPREAFSFLVSPPLAPLSSHLLLSPT